MVTPLEFCFPMRIDCVIVPAPIIKGMAIAEGSCCNEPRNISAALYPLITYLYATIKKITPPNARRASVRMPSHLTRILYPVSPKRVKTKKVTTHAPAKMRANSPFRKCSIKPVKYRHKANGLRIARNETKDCQKLSIIRLSILSIAKTPLQHPGPCADCFFDPLHS